MSVDKIVHCPFVPNTYSIPDLDFGSIVFNGLSMQPSAKAMTNISTGETIKNGEFIERAVAMARRLTSYGCRKGDVVAIFSPNSIDWMLVAAATHRLGATIAGINCLLTSGELASQLGLSRAKLLFTVPALANIALEGIKTGTTVQKILLNADYPGCTKLSTRLPQIQEQLPILLPIQELHIQPQDVALIMFSSGTTGPQKAVLLSHRSLVSVVELHKSPLLFIKEPEIIAIGPNSHVTGFFWTMINLAFGCHVLFDEKFNFSTYLKILAKHKITAIGIVPPIATLLAKSPEVDQYKLHLKHIRCGAAPLSQELENILMKRFPGLEVRQGYGLTETIGCSLCVPYDLDSSTSRTKRRPGSVGVPMHMVQIKVVDPETGISQGPNSPGELLIKSPIVMLGYAQNPSATAATIDKDEWLHSGDIGYYDEDGYFYIVDRLKELIKYNAYQVAPAELEAVLLSHPEIADAGVIGIPDASAGELPMAWVVKKDGATVSEKAIQSYVADKVAPYKALRGGVRFVPVIPKSASGKILRREMRKAATQGHL